MGIHDRPYMRGGGQGGYRTGSGSIRLGLPPVGIVTLVLIGACTLLFLATVFTGSWGSPLYGWLAFVPARFYEVWRLVSFQFMHGDTSHFLWNMVGLYFFASPLERAWGPRRFLVFYLVCGAFAAVCGMLLAVLWPWARFVPLVGASGGILGCLAACAVLFPEMIVLIFPIRWVAAFLVVLYVLNILWSASGPGGGLPAISDAAHLGGMLAAGAWLWGIPRLRGTFLRARVRRGRGAWKRQVEQEARRRAEIDRILDKVRADGIASLTGRERRTLQEETRRQQELDRDPAGRG